MTTLQLANAFETPIILDMLPGAETANAELRAIVLERRKSDSGVQKSNWNGWQSDIDMLNWGEAPARKLADHFLKLCANFTVGQAPDLAWTVDMWSNVSSAGSSNEAHVHPGVVWSAVYYVDDGYNGSPNPELGGNLVLYDPRMPFVRMLPYGLRYRRPDGQPADSQLSVRPISGRIVMFPPWLYHSVHPFHGTGTRISIAMNANVAPAR
jgi:uncharacterized protein (TIGR02466 family)